MSIFDRLSKQDIDSQFTHRGWFAGLVPVYVNLKDDAPLIVERNWIPEWYFTLVETLFGVFCFCISCTNPDTELGFPILITEDI